MSENFKPLGNRVLIQPLEKTRVTSGGIIIPDVAVKQEPYAKVIAVGPGKPDEPMIVKEGDIVYYNENTTMNASFLGPEFLLVREPDLIGIILNT